MQKKKKNHTTLKIGHYLSTVEEYPDRKYYWVTPAGSDCLKSRKKISSPQPGMNSVFEGIMNGVICQFLFLYFPSFPSRDGYLQVFLPPWLPALSIARTVAYGEYGYV